MKSQHIYILFFVLIIAGNLQAQPFTVSGNTGVSNVQLNWTDGTPQSTTSNGSGNYSISVSNNWSGTVTPSKSGYTFTPSSYSYTNITADTANQDFTANPVLITISGNTGVGNTDLNWTDGTPQSTSSNGTGDYSLTVSYDWTGTITPSKTDYVFTPTSRSYTNLTTDQSSENYTASLVTYTLGVVKGGTGSGSILVDSSPESLPYSSDFNNNDIVSLEAVSDVSSSFSGWSGDLSGSTNPQNITMNSAKNVTANFVLNSYTITASAGSNGSISPSGAVSVSHGDDQTFNISANTGYSISDVLVDGASVGAVSSYEFTNVTANHTISAQFVINTYTISLSSNPTNGGTTSGGGTYDYNTTVNLTATPATGYTFTNWSEGGSSVSTNSNYSFSATSNRNLTANFSLNDYTITATAGTGGSISPSGAVSVSHGDDQTFNISANTGYSISNVLVDGASVGAVSSYEFTNVTANHTISAQFVINTYSISLSSNPTNGGTTSGGGTYDYNTTVNLTATPATGYTFTNWSEGGSSVSTNSNYSFSATSDRNLTANFSLNDYTITASAGSGGSISPLGAVSVSHGDDQTFNISANTGYSISNVLVDGVSVGAVSSYEFANVTANHTISAQFVINTYTISLSSNPTNGGTTSGGGTYNYNATVNLTATPTTGYSFTNWSESGSSVSTNSNYSFSATSNRNLTANFSLNSYTITATAGSNGSISPSGGVPVSHGDDQTFNISANTGYSISNVLVDGVSVGAVSSYEFTNVTANHTISAQFVINTYTISLTSDPTNGGTTSGGGTYNYNTTVNLAATPATGYTFTNWSESGSSVSTNPNYSFSATSDRNLTANFSLNSYTIATSSSPAAGGTTSGGGTFNHGANVNLTATPATGYTFINWTESGAEVSQNTNYSFVAEESRNLIANFLINKYDVTTDPSPTNGGTASGDGTFDHGSLVTVTANPNVGWNFDNWAEGNQNVSSNKNYSFVILQDRDLTARFSKKVFTINTSSEPDDGGTTSGSGDYEYDSDVTITASPNTGWEFINWTENDKVAFTQNIVSFSAEEDRDLVAHFKKKVYEITTTANPEEGGNIDGDSTYTHGDEVTVEAFANSESGWDFVNWTENGSQVSTNAQYTFTATAERDLVANFELRTYSVILSVNPSGAGTATGGGTYTHGDSVTISATPGPGWLFANWAENTLNLSDEKIYKFQITSNRNITANFANILYSINASPNPIDAGVISGTGSAFFGQNITIIAVPNVGWDFNNWTENDNIVSNLPEYAFSVSGDRTLVANFSLTNFSIACSAFPAEAGITSGCGISFYNQEMTVKAIANNGWEFIKWTENGEEVSTSTNYSFTVDSDRALVANFDLVSHVERLDESQIIPETYTLSNAYPNPFNPETNVQFGLPESSEVTITIFDNNGQIVDKLLDKASLPAGNYLSRFNANEITSGIYFYHIFAHSFNSSKNIRKVCKLVLLK